MEWTDIDQDRWKWTCKQGSVIVPIMGKTQGGNIILDFIISSGTGRIFSKQVIDYGPYGQGKGTGVFFTVFYRFGKKNGNKDNYSGWKKMALYIITWTY